MEVEPRPDTVRADETPEQAYLIVHAGGEVYAINGSVIREIARWRSPTPVPNVPALLPGIISQRGVILPVVDLRVLLDLPAHPPDRATRLVICQHEPFDLAILVDRVEDLTLIDQAELEPPPNGLPATAARIFSAVTRLADRPLALIDLSALITVVQEGL
ncbi:MAG: purine-binding chemotaxis protein CheW [Oscillochloris sp.]|nr:purine-binding chemotaxis protein CheW [Oscillochloris sp.]